MLTWPLPPALLHPPPTLSRAIQLGQQLNSAIKPLAIQFGKIPRGKLALCAYCTWDHTPKLVTNVTVADGCHRDMLLCVTGSKWLFFL